MQRSRVTSRAHCAHAYVQSSIRRPRGSRAGLRRALPGGPDPGALRGIDGADGGARGAGGLSRLLLGGF